MVSIPHWVGPHYNGQVYNNISQHPHLILGLIPAIAQCKDFKMDKMTCENQSTTTRNSSVALKEKKIFLHHQLISSLLAPGNHATEDYFSLGRKCPAVCNDIDESEGL